ncbi:MAG: hypothetical protein AB1665_06820 [Candidatus Thermoplasmatota archaeon]
MRLTQILLAFALLSLSLLSCTGSAGATSPISSAILSGGYWRSAPSISVGWEAACDAGLRNISLLSRHSVNNLTFDPWVTAGVIELEGEKNTSSIEHGPFSILLEAEGYYQFTTVAAGTDGAGEQILGPDCLLGLDLTLPSSSLTQGAYYVSLGQITLDIEASDLLSGVEEIQVWARSSFNNITWSSWSIAVSHAHDGTVLPLIDGFYQFHVRARDAAGNIELAKPAEARYCVDATPPNCTARAMAPWSKVPWVILDLSLEDATSGVSEMEMWSAESPNNRTWKNWTRAHAALTERFNFTAPHDGYFGFYARGRDMAGHWEPMPQVPEVVVGVDTSPPLLHHEQSSTQLWVGQVLNLTVLCEGEFEDPAVYLWYTDVNGTEHTVPMYKTESGGFIAQLNVQPKPGILRYRIWAVDRAGNIATTEERALTVVRIGEDTLDVWGLAPWAALGALLGIAIVGCCILLRKRQRPKG